MVGIILASHGEFANGILQSGAMIFGDQEDVAAVTLLPSEGPEDVRAKMEEAIASFSDPDQVLFLVDLWGGTPFNQASNLFEGHEDSWAIVSGMNLPMVIEAYASRFSMETAQEIAGHILATAKEGVKPLPEGLAKDEEETEQVQAEETPASSGQVGSPGQMDFVLARIDSRLLHGQVATGWTRATHPTRIIVVSDAVAKDELRTQLIKQAAPSGIKAHVIPIDQMIKIGKDQEHFGKERALLLFENPQDVLRVVEGGVPLEEINVGSMAHSKGKVQPNKVLAFSQDDIDTFQALKDQGLRFDVRKVPADQGDNIDSILQQAQKEIDKQNA
ncbi:PTS sugar transporter subunit IIB [Aerococcus sp. UMB7834]|uniref:PTS sugar transporter subunit IIB n=1 Tax=Aerococcus sp. UMB7834 TaxID=3046342 RepID=UPI002549E119|nr:PTS sugar transporter subunit IIB [Aerococcus sp. UMB7834]MDK6805815.1 PTS sugar transporter subunit IIB [Aerococcus sp. UMB7834]